ncbi:MAG: hypothetical protein JST54_13870 [Deltaproteobacteria bacterium]|nr:hypothetical protein [Deltaproteobacteria bacterium]
MKKLFWSVLLLGIAGCGMGSVSDGGDVSSDGDALSTTTPGYVTLVKDQRKCASPICGGYFLVQPNRSVAQIYVAALDWGQSGLSDTDVSNATSAADGELLLFGTLTRQDRTTGTKSFVVLDAYRGMPGRAPASGDVFATVADNGTRCIQAPCKSNNLTKINSTAKPKAFSDLSVASASAAFVDQTWLTNRVMNAGAIVAGSVVSGEQLPGGTQSVLDASQVFLHLPEGMGPCSHHVVSCANGKVQIFERDANRCVTNTGCATPGMCSQMIPACADGYTLSSWRATTNACNDFACDPTWVVQQ